MKFGEITIKNIENANDISGSIRPTHLLFFFTRYVCNILRTIINNNNNPDLPI
jgi:hypothetical protein